MSADVVFVSGAASGIGREIAREVARAGGTVAATYWGDQADLAAYANELEGLGARVMLENVDVRDESAYADFAHRAHSMFGAFDLWVNCAARLFVQPFLETTEQDWLDLLDSNLLGYVRGCRYAATVVRDGGSIINVSSITAQQAPAGLSAYVAAKGAVDALTRALAVELAPRLRVNAVAPGAIDTELNAKSWTPVVRDTYTDRSALKRLGTPAEIARTVVALAGESMSFVTGQVLVADGGLLINGTVGHEHA